VDSAGLWRLGLPTIALPPPRSLWKSRAQRYFHTERGRMMWARVKGRTENALLEMAFKAAYMFRPGYIQPLHGIASSTRLTRVLYAVMRPLYPVWKTLFPKYVTTTEQLGLAMIHVAKHGAPKRILENRDLAGLVPTEDPPPRST